MWLNDQPLGNPTQLTTSSVEILNAPPNDDCQASNKTIYEIPTTTIAAATTTKTTATITTTCAKVSNLIVAMMDDVSKTINDNNEAGKIVGTQSQIGGGNDDGGFAVDECVSDFPIKATYTGKSNSNKNSNNNDTKERKKNTNTNNKNNKNIGTFADASKLRNTTRTTMKARVTEIARRPLQIAGEPMPTSCKLTTMSAEKISPTTTIKTTKITSTMPPTHTRRTVVVKGRSSTTKTTTNATTTTTTTTTAITMKNSLAMRKNKCPTSEPSGFSSTRASKVSTSSTSSIYGRHYNSTATKTFSNRWPRTKNIRCELLESNENKQILPKIGIKSTAIARAKQLETISSSLNQPALRLAEQKAKLRLEFFKDITITEIQSSEAEEIEEPKEKFGICTEKKTEVFQQKSLPKRQQHNLRLEIFPKEPSTSSESTESSTVPTVLTSDTGEDLVEPTPTLTLVERRKLELARKFADQRTTKISTRSQKPLQEFRRVAQLVKKFDKQQKIPLLYLYKSKMIVNPKESSELRNDQDRLTLKPEAQDQRHSSPLSDEGCNLGQSPYSTDDEEHDNNDDNASVGTASTTIEAITTTARSTKRKDKVTRSASSDSALGLEVDDPMDATSPSAGATAPTGERQQKRRMTLTVTDLPLRPALLPLAEPTTLPDSPTPELQQTLQNLLAQTTVPSKVILEERVVEIPEDHVRSTSIASGGSITNSRRESQQSCISDYPASIDGGIASGVRFVRTPSVVVSDYSDDVMCGITLEEIEYFRAHRLRRRSSVETTGNERDGDLHSDVSATSSCSNLYYCGSTISALDGSECMVNGVRVPLERKTSDCSTCSTSGNEDETTSTSSSAFTITEDHSASSRDIVDLLAAQHLSSKRAKKVGGVGVGIGIGVGGATELMPPMDFHENRFQFQ